MLLVPVRCQFECPQLEDVGSAVLNAPAWRRLSIARGARIAVAVGSRGIASLASIVRATVAALRERGAMPFVIPAMGSHGGATAEGQLEVLASYGVTEAAMGCPIRSSMEVVPLPDDGLEAALFMDRFAWDSDGVVVINRIKPHTDFHGRYESGLAKMCVIGLGKERQASELHQHGVRGLRDLMPLAAARVLTLGKVIGGVGTVENARDETALIEVIPADRILEREPELLEIARRNLPRLPVDSIDVLIVDRIGKDISGAGMDTNIIGRLRIRGEPEPATPDIHSIVVCDLTDATHGNATGIGLADVTTRRLFERIDFAITNKNIVTSSFLERGKIPVIAETDADGLQIALRASGAARSGPPRVVRILDTLHLQKIWVSDAVLADIRGREDIEVLGGPVEIFDSRGRLIPESGSLQ